MSYLLITRFKYFMTTPKALWICLAALLISSNAMAWSEARYTDVELVNRSDLIVVGHLKRDSLKHRPHLDSHAVLVVTRIIKGVSQTIEIPITISLLPAPNTYRSADDFANNDLSPRTYDWTKPIVLFDNNPDGGSEYPLIDDIRIDQIWLLRHSGSGKAGDWRVRDPQDIQQLSKESDLRKQVK